MKTGKSTYYPALWEETATAPPWNSKRVWEQIEQAQSNKKKTSWYWLIWFVALFTLTGIRPISSVGIEQPVSHPHNTPPAVEKEPRQAPHKPNLAPVIATTPEPRAIPKRRNSLTPGEKSHAAALALEERSEPASRPYIAPTLALAPKQPKALTNSARPILRRGTKLTLRVPLLPETPPNNNTYLVRLFQELKQWNTDGTIDWENINILPNDKGGFVLFQYKSTSTTKSN